jgi:hypothetical protein
LWRKICKSKPGSTVFFKGDSAVRLIEREADSCGLRSLVNPYACFQWNAHLSNNGFTRGDAVYLTHSQCFELLQKLHKDVVCVKKHHDDFIAFIQHLRSLECGYDDAYRSWHDNVEIWNLAKN